MSQDQKQSQTAPNWGLDLSLNKGKGVTNQDKDKDKNQDQQKDQKSQVYIGLYNAPVCDKGYVLVKGCGDNNSSDTPWRGDVRPVVLYLDGKLATEHSSHYMFLANNGGWVLCVNDNNVLTKEKQTEIVINGILYQYADGQWTPLVKPDNCDIPLVINIETQTRVFDLYHIDGYEITAICDIVNLTIDIKLNKGQLLSPHTQGSALFNLRKSTGSHTRINVNLIVTLKETPPVSQPLRTRFSGFNEWVPRAPISNVVTNLAGRLTEGLNAAGYRTIPYISAKKVRLPLFELSQPGLDVYLSDVKGDDVAAPPARTTLAADEAETANIIPNIITARAVNKLATQNQAAKHKIELIIQSHTPVTGGFLEHDNPSYEVGDYQFFNTETSYKVSNGRGVAAAFTTPSSSLSSSSSNNSDQDKKQRQPRLNATVDDLSVWGVTSGVPQSTLHFQISPSLIKHPAYDNEGNLVIEGYHTIETCLDCDPIVAYTVEDGYLPMVAYVEFINSYVWVKYPYFEFVESIVNNGNNFFTHQQPIGTKPEVGGLIPFLPKVILDPIIVTTMSNLRISNIKSIVDHAHDQDYHSDEQDYDHQVIDHNDNHNSEHEQHEEKQHEQHEEKQHIYDYVTPSGTQVVNNSKEQSKTEVDVKTTKNASQHLDVNRFSELLSKLLNL